MNTATTETFGRDTEEMWQIEVCRTTSRFLFFRIVDGKIAESYRPVSQEEASVWAVSIIQGFQPPRSGFEGVLEAPRMTEAERKSEKNPPDANEVRWRMEAACLYAGNAGLDLAEAAKVFNEALDVIRQGSSDHRS